MHFHSKPSRKRLHQVEKMKKTNLSFQDMLGAHDTAYAALSGWPKGPVVFLRKIRGRRGIREGEKLSLRPPPSSQIGDGTFGGPIGKSTHSLTMFLAVIPPPAK